MAMIAALGAAILLLLVFILRGGIRAPDPVVGPPGELEPLPSSSLRLPVVYDPAPLLETLETVVPARIGDLSERRPHPSDPALRYAFQAERDPFEVELRGDTVHLSTVIRYGGRMWYASPFGGDLTAACGLAQPGSEAPRARIRLSSPLEVDEDWNLHSEMRVEEVAPLTPEDRCRASVLQLELDVTDLIMAAAEAFLEEQTEAIDATLEELDLLPHVEPFWDALRDPIPLAEGAWLILDPTGLAGGRLGGMNAGDPNIRTEIGILARPRIVMGAPPAPSSMPLPPLDRDASPGVGAILVDASLDYDYLSEVLAWALAGEPMRIGEREIRIREVRASEADDGRLRLDLEVEGAVDARLRIVGTPVYDPGSGELTVPDLELAVERGGALVRTGAWVLRTAFPGYLRSQARFPAADFVEAGRGLAAAGLNHRFSEEARMEGRVDSVEIVRVVATPGGVVVRTRIEAEARLVIGDG